MGEWKGIAAESVPSDKIPPLGMGVSGIGVWGQRRERWTDLHRKNCLMLTATYSDQLLRQIRSLTGATLPGVL